MVGPVASSADLTGGSVVKFRFSVDGGTGCSVANLGCPLQVCCNLFRFYGVIPLFTGGEMREVRGVHAVRLRIRLRTDARRERAHKMT